MELERKIQQVNAIVAVIGQVDEGLKIGKDAVKIGREGVDTTKSFLELKIWFKVLVGFVGIYVSKSVLERRLPPPPQISPPPPHYQG